MQSINLYAYGRSTVEGEWGIDQSRTVNRLYYVNAGRAHIRNASREHVLTEGRLYIIPQCNDFRPVDAVNFDHTFFDFYSTRIFRNDRILEWDAAHLHADSLFDYVNTLLSERRDPVCHAAMEHFLAGLLLAIECRSGELPYMTNPLITRAVALIHEDCAAASTMRLAERLNLNESYLVRLFRRTMGTSPMKYIRACRVQYGKELLDNGARVAEAAEKCGYASPSAFYKVMQAEMHRAPSALKKKDL